MKFLVISIIVVLVILFVFVFTWWAVFLPKSPYSVPGEEFLVEKGEGIKKISFNLKKQGLIKNRNFFELYVFLTGKAKKLQAGRYLISNSESIAKIARKVSSGEVIKMKLTIPEGFKIKQIEERLIEKGLIEGVKLKDLKAALFKDKFKFLEQVPEDTNLEGYLFPDTYQFLYNDKAQEIAQKMLENFDKKLTLNLRKEIAKQNKSIFEIITMASLIEKEVRTLEEKKKVSGILWKRLKAGIPLQVDATIIYILSDSEKYPERYITGKKTTKVSRLETYIDSPYNTYKYLGLPVGPICNPGIESIKAAIYPQDSDSWYYLSTPEGETIFSKTLEKHNIAKARYLR